MNNTCEYEHKSYKPMNTLEHTYATSNINKIQLNITDLKYGINRINSDSKITEVKEGLEHENLHKPSTQFSCFNSNEKLEKIGLSSFSCIGILGKGSFGIVYLVEHKATKNLYAMKILSKNKIMSKRKN